MLIYIARGRDEYQLRTLQHQDSSALRKLHVVADHGPRLYLGMARFQRGDVEIIARQAGRFEREVTCVHLQLLGQLGKSHDECIVRGDGSAHPLFAQIGVLRAEWIVFLIPHLLMGYGTGAIMAVPAHDARDFEFARRFGLPIVPVVAPADGKPLPGEAHLGEGELIRSGPFTGLHSREARPQITDWLSRTGRGTHAVNYRLHDWCISRQRYWGPPIPMVYCDGCGTVSVPEDQLPVRLPYIQDFVPDGSGQSPLARDPDFVTTVCPQCGQRATRETDVSDNFLDSAWYFFRYPSARCGDAPFNRERTRKWLPVHMYIGGHEHAVLHLMYTRFLTMALRDMGLIGFTEPFVKFRAHGLITKDGAKMSKSRGNVVNPDTYLDQ